MMVSPNRFPSLLTTASTVGMLMLLSSSTGITDAFVPSGVIVSTSSSTATTSVRPLNLFGIGGNNDNHPHHDGNSIRETNDVRRKLEFKNLEPLEEPEARRQRKEQDKANQAQFEKFGDDLWELRAEMEDLTNQLQTAMSQGLERKKEQTRQKLREIESRDPELTYMLALAEAEFAVKEGRVEDADKHRAKAAAARSCLPQFNLDGLWVGRYGSSYDLINITYVGDTLIAEKVTGDGNVPMEAISFQADLNPLRQRAMNRNRFESGGDGTDSSSLQPIVLTEKAAMKWGTKKLPRYAGLGQVAERNFRNRQWTDGQLIIIGDEYFSFAWLPIEEQIFFGRPTPELALKMLRESRVSTVPKQFDTPPSTDDALHVQMEYVARCLEVSQEVHEDDLEGNSFGGIWHGDNETNDCYFE